MSNIVLRTDVVNSTVIPGLTSVSDKIKTAQSKCSSLQSLLPSSFPNTAQVSKLSYSLNNSVSEVLAAKKTISQKVEYASNIENKHSSKTSSLLAKLGGAAGAIFGAASGGVLGAVAGGIIGSKVAEPIVKTGAKIAKGAVSAVKGLFTKVGNGIKKAATAIKNTGAKVVKGFVSGAKKVVSSVGSGIKKAASAIKNTGAKIVKGFVSGVKKVGKAVSDGIKKVGAKVCKAVKSFAGGVKKVVSAVGSGIKKVGNFLKNTGAKVVKGFVSGVKKVGKAIGDGLKWAGGKIVDAGKSIVSGVKWGLGKLWDGAKWLGKHALKLGATIVNAAVSLVEGIVSFVEAIGDVVLLAAGVVGSIGGLFVDLYQGLTGKGWDLSATGSVWKDWALPWVAYDWTSKAFEWQGKWIINDWAYKPFKRGETGAKITKGIGYVAGIVVASVFTAGAAGAASAGTSAISGGASAVTSLVTTGTSAASSTLAMSVSSGIIAGSAKAAKSMQDGYNKLSDEDKQSTSALWKLGGSSVLSGVVEGTTWALTTGTATKVMSGNSGVIGKVGNAFVNKGTQAKAVMQATKAYATEGISVITDGEFDLKSATIDAGVSAATSVLYDAGVKKGVDLLDKKITPPKVEDDAALDALAAGNTSSTVKDKFIETTGKIVHGTNVVLKNKSTSKIVGKTVKDPIKTGMEGAVDFVEGKLVA